MITQEEIEKNYDFLDKIAIQTMISYLNKRPPTGFHDSMSISRLSYKHALAMLEVRENSLISLATEAGLIKKTKKDE